MNQLQNIQIKNSLNHITKDLETLLENIIDYDLNNIKSGITSILENYSNMNTLYDYMVICDNTYTIHQK